MLVYLHLVDLKTVCCFLVDLKTDCNSAEVNLKNFKCTLIPIDPKTVVHARKRERTAKVSEGLLRLKTTLGGCRSSTAPRTKLASRTSRAWDRIFAPALYIDLHSVPESPDFCATSSQETARSWKVTGGCRDRTNQSYSWVCMCYMGFGGRWSPTGLLPFPLYLKMDWLQSKRLLRRSRHNNCFGLDNNFDK